MEVFVVRDMDHGCIMRTARQDCVRRTSQRCQAAHLSPPVARRDQREEAERWTERKSNYTAHYETMVVLWAAAIVVR